MTYIFQILIVPEEHCLFIESVSKVLDVNVYNFTSLV